MRIIGSYTGRSRVGTTWVKGCGYQRGGGEPRAGETRERPEERRLQERAEPGAGESDQRLRYVCMLYVLAICVRAPRARRRRGPGRGPGARCPLLAVHRCSAPVARRRCFIP